MYEPTGIVTGAASSFYSSLGQFKVQFLFLTHILVTIYVGVNAIIAAKLMYMTILGKSCRNLSNLCDIAVADVLLRR